MDDHPQQGHSEDGSGSEDEFVLAYEDQTDKVPPDKDPPDEELLTAEKWFDAQLPRETLGCSSISRLADQNKKGTSYFNKDLFSLPASSNKPTDHEHEPMMEHQAAGGSEKVLETNLDTMQQGHINPIKSAVPDKYCTDKEAGFIIFHALVPTDTKYNPETDQVSLYMWDRDHREPEKINMFFSRRHQDANNSAEVYGFVLLQRNRYYGNTEYQYHIKRNTLTKKSRRPRKEIWEEVYAHTSNGRRQMPRIYGKDVTGNHHIYGGFIYRPTKKPKQSMFVSGMKTIVNLIFQGNSKEDDAKMVAITSGRDIISNLLQIEPNVGSVLEAYHMTICLMRSVEETYKLTSRKVRQALWDMYKETLNRWNSGTDEVGIRNKISLCILMLKLRKHISHRKDDPANDVLCRSMLLTCVPESSIVIEWTVLQHNFGANDRAELKDHLIALASDMAQYGHSHVKNPLWMYLIPMIHFLEGVCQPFQNVKLEANHDANIPVWWGVDGSLKNAKEQYKSRYGYSWKISLTEVFSDLKHMFGADFYLPRSVLACLNLEELKDAFETRLFPPDACCAAVNYFMKAIGGYHSNQIEKCLECILTQMKETGDSIKQRNLWIGINISCDLFKRAIKQKAMSIVSKSAEIFLLYLTLYDTCKPDESCSAFLQNLKLPDLKAICKVAGHWIQEQCYGMQLLERLRVWDHFLLPFGLESTPHTQEWTDLIKEELSNVITKEMQTYTSGRYQRLLVEAYCSGKYKFSPALQDTLAHFVSMVLNEEFLSTQTDMKQEEYAKLWQIMAKKFVEECDKFTDKGGLNLEIMLTWSSLPIFLKVLKAKEITENQKSDTEQGTGTNDRPDSDEKDITENIEVGPNAMTPVGTASQVRREEKTPYYDKMNHISALVEICIKSLEDGIISGNELTLVSKHEDSLLSLVQLVTGKTESVKKALKVRTSELTGFQRKISAIYSFKSLLSDLKSVNINTEPIDDILGRDIRTSLLTELIEVSGLDLAENLDYSDVVIVSKNLTEQVMSMIIDTQRLSDSNCFKTFWTDETNNLTTDETLTLEDIYCNVYLPAKKRLDRAADEISSGTVLYADMEDIFGRTYGDNYSSLWYELSKVCQATDTSIIRERVNQLRCFRHVISMTEAASAIVGVRDKYELTGDFSPLEEINRCDIHDLPLNSDIQDMMSAVQSFGNITNEKTTCLTTFEKCEELVTWLRNVNEDGLTELKVFVDLAIISAGDDTEKIARVQSLHVGVTGYSSLIFELEKGSDWQEFLQKCKPVWEELQNTPTLADKLDHAARYLYWFQDIKQAHGAVEVTSFVQAKVINEHGIYKIGKRVWNGRGMFGRDSSSTEILDIGQILKLTVVVDKAQEVPKEYTYEKLQDLQSRLMLVAGQTEKSTSKGLATTSTSENNKESVERFNLVLEGVVRLCNIYIKLVNSGCMLFQDFAIKLYCDTNPDRPICAVLEFDNLNDLKCIKTDREPLENIMHTVADCMENYYSDWLNYVDSSRKQYQELNYFTSKQLVILQTEIAKIIIKQSPSEMIFPLLHVIKRNCTAADIRKAIISASQEIETRQDILPRTPPNHGLDVLTAMKDDPKKTEFIQALSSVGYDPLIPFALLEFPDFNISEALYWCMNNENNVDELEARHQIKTQKEYESDEMASMLYGETSVIDVINRAIHSRSQFDRCEAMLLKLDEIWNDFLESISTDTMAIVSLKHLGIILHQLSTTEKGEFHRTLPKGFSESTPNLVICEEDEIWCQTLTLYLSNLQQPLPQSDEILTCSESTTMEQVDIFLRRAFFFSNGKIHCLVNADQMGFTVCGGMEKRLETFQNIVGQISKFRLVFICGSEGEHRSVVISALDKFRRTGVWVDLELLVSNLSSKLQASEEEVEHNTSAAAVDFNRSTVRLIKSTRSGVGKTLYKKRREQELQQRLSSESTLSVSLPLHERRIDTAYVSKHLLPYTLQPDSNDVRIFHIDITDEVRFGTDNLLFNLLVLGCLTDTSGFVWRKSPKDLYLIETIDRISSSKNKKPARAKEVQMLKLLPYVTCRSPKESLDVYMGRTLSDFSPNDQLFDEKLYGSDLYKRPYRCLKAIDNCTSDKTSEGDCIKILLDHCGISNPSWAEIHHFVKFLNTQLLNFEETDFVGEHLEDVLPGFPMFVQRFLIQMSRDFSSRSLEISERSMDKTNNKQAELGKYKMKRKWEQSPHPYIFFNADRQSFTFLGFNINRAGDLVDQQTKRILEKGIMSKPLLHGLLQNDVPINEDFDALKRSEKIARLCKVIGVREYDENAYDRTYELTTDNSKKILAVYMRLRCDIPVIVMGETGCGKTRLIKFLCELMVPRDTNTLKPSITTNMIIMKVHGGVTNEDITAKVRQAEQLAHENSKLDQNMYTVLFFDEANTTESIGLIKEIICDKTMEGKPLQINCNLKFVAACNPYRGHSEELITKLENAGLGYHVHKDETKDRFGEIPMRHLVYRVQPLPQSLLPFVWDFGQLSADVENLYIRQMVRRYMEGGLEGSGGHMPLPKDEELIGVISSILTESQQFMRNLEDECSFVSLRDVERVLHVMSWFYTRCKDRRTMFNYADKKLTERNEKQTLNDETRSLVLAIGLCYHASLTNRSAYRDHIAHFFTSPCKLPGGSDQMLEEIDRIQEVFLDSVILPDNIARNQALKENVFMMTMCIELRIPLFLVGKPGSSKSLAKVIIADAMQGRAARKELFREFKQIQMVSFQCSPLSTPGGIVSAFRQCASFQEHYKDNLDKFASVVVLDEIGLAEDSPRMPLKTLHPLLEDGCQGDETPEDYKKVAFIGISNWSLDPAKMNRGLFVQREVPDLMELQNTARGIWSSAKQLNNSLVTSLAKAYLEVFKMASDRKREFYGLRDFYSLMKMIKSFAEKSEGSKIPSYLKIKFAVERNFGGFETLDTSSIFLEEVKHPCPIKERQPGDPDVSFNGLIKSWLEDENGDSRYLLLMTDNYSALSVFQQAFLSEGIVQPVVIFGSSFRRDLEYTQVCRNINKIKVCMETGNLVILVNSDNLYESLYDALNQYYVNFGGERYVDLGLGTHRVKCPVHKQFKLIVVADKQIVYDKFPTPLINRLEKHCFSSRTLLTTEQRHLERELRQWAEDVTKESLSLNHSPTESDVKKVFIGYHPDVYATIALQVWTKDKNFGEREQYNKAFSQSKGVLIWCAAPDAIVRVRSNRNEHFDIYWKQQAHESLTDYLAYHFTKRKCSRLYSQVTTHSTLLTAAHKPAISEVTEIDKDHILLLDTLSSFDTEQQFIRKIKDFIGKYGQQRTLVVIQCDFGDSNANLIACAKYSILDECIRLSTISTVSLLFIVQLTPMENKHFQSIQGGEWHSVHIDNLYIPVVDMPSIQFMLGKHMSELVTHSIEVRHSTTTNNVVHNDEEETGQTEKRLNMRELMARSIQRAMSLVKDPRGNISRSTERVSLILSVIHGDKKEDSEIFVNEISTIIRNVMAERENQMEFDPDWLESEVSSCKKIQIFGTLRRACLQTFDAKLSPILAGVFAKLDTNQNLSFLIDGSTGWKRNLWLRLIGTVEICHYMNTQIISNGVILTDVKGTGFGGQIFQCRMPFSWVIYQMWEGVLKQHDQYEDENENRERYLDVIGSSEIATVIDTLPRALYDEIVDAYIFDYVQTVYPEEKDRQLVCMSMKHFTYRKVKVETSSLSQILICVHKVYREQEASLKNFRNISSVWSGCNNAILNNNGNLTENNELALLALLLLLESISPSLIDRKRLEEYFDTANGREHWLGIVHRYRQVIIQTLEYYKETIESIKLVNKTRVINQLQKTQIYDYHVTKFKDFPKVLLYCFNLLNLLNENRDSMEQIDILKKVEKFLGLCYSLVMHESKTKTKKCLGCDAPLTVRGKLLPCTHEICESCVNEILCESSSEQKCPDCKRQLDKDWETQSESDEKVNSWISDKLLDYRRRCSSFLMEVVSQLCFASDTAPKFDVVYWLMSYSFFQTTDEKMGVEFNAVFKSLIFKHLVRTDEHGLRVHLERYIQTTSEDQEVSKHMEDVILVVLHGIENNLYSGKKLNENFEITKATHFLKSALECFESHSSKPVEQIYAIARARIGLSTSANYIKKLVFKEVNLGMNELQEFDEMLFCSKSLCDGQNRAWQYLLGCITSKFGTDVIITACMSEDERINWIKTEAIEHAIDDIADMYCVYEDTYAEIKDCVLETWIRGEESALVEHVAKLKVKEDSHVLAVVLELAVHRAVLLKKNDYENAQAIVKLKTAMQEIQGNKKEHRGHKSLLVELDQEKRGRWSLNVISEMDSRREINMKCLIFHWRSVLVHLPQNSCMMLQPLINLAFEPRSTVNNYCPTMPHDEMAELKDALLKSASEEFTDQKTKYYKCPNGHLYEIGECGRPWTTAKCICGADIGGTLHRLLSSNERDDGPDRTVGHCLGDPYLRKPGAVEERSLTATQCAMIRLLLHCTMFIGCGSSLKDICHLITPNIDETEVYKYVWDHILLDIDDLRASLSLNVDDVLMFYHGFIDHILRKSVDNMEHAGISYKRSEGIWDEISDQDTEDTESLSQWATKENRAQWEVYFSDKYCEQFIKEKDVFLNESRSMMNGSCKLMAIINEITNKGTGDAITDVQSLQNNSKLWVYRKPLSISHLQQTFQTNREMRDLYPILSLFFNQDSDLQAVRYIPRILKFHTALLRRYNRVIYKSEASKITLAQIKTENVCGDETESLIDDVIEAWNLSKHAIKTYVFRSEKGPTTFPLELQDVIISDKTTIEYLLPTMDGKGVLTYALLDWLIHCHNTVMEAYRTKRGNSDYRPSTIQPKALTTAHLISFHPDKDLLPIILSNCFINEDGIVDDGYNFEAIEKRVIERFISTKSEVVVDRYPQVDLMTYRSDITVSSIFEDLCRKIPQERFETEVKTVLCSDIRDVPLINQIVSNLDIAISFLNITGGNRDDSLNDFMVRRLKMSKNALTPKMQQACQLKHVKSLWITLSQHRSAIMVRQNKPIEMVFENVDARCHKTIHGKVEESYMSYVQQLSKERLHQLIDVLFEFIVDELTKRHNEYDDDYIDRGQFRLGDCLSAFADVTGRNISVHDFPNSILCVHSLHVWIAASKSYHEREACTAI